MTQRMSYTFSRERRDYGRQCNFSDKSQMLVSIPPNRDLFKDYLLRNPVSRTTETPRQMALSVCNTESVEFDSKGVMHSEGGWPKDINYLDPEQTVRYKRKIEKDENYITQVLTLAKHLEHAINQNNAVNIYELYFDGLEPPPLMARCSSRTVNVYRDPAPKKRPVTHISWSPDNGSKIAVSHCDTSALCEPNETASYIWEVENPNRPLYTLSAQSSSICLEYNSKESNMLISGMFNGQVAAWDVRASKEPSELNDNLHLVLANVIFWHLY